jgi:hypothetical protein
MIDLPDIKRGDTFYYLATWEGAKRSELKSQIRNDAGRLISEVVIEDTETADTFKLSVNDTTNFTIGLLYTDIERTANGIIQSSVTMKFNVERDETK